MARKRRRAAALPRALDCLKLKHRDGYARYLAGRSEAEIEAFLVKIYAEGSRRKHFLHPPGSSCAPGTASPLTFVDRVAHAEDLGRPGRETRTPARPEPPLDTPPVPDGADVEDEEAPF